MQHAVCPVCAGTDAIVKVYGFLDQNVDCSVCGSFKIQFVAIEDIKESADAVTRAALSAATRAGSEICVTAENWRILAQAYAGLSVTTKLTSLLEVLRKKSGYIGERVEFVPRKDYPLVAARSPEECNTILRHAAKLGWVVVSSSSTELTIPGWHQLEPSGSGVPGLCFIAMAFRKELEEAFTLGVLPAVEKDCGLRAIRIDRVHHNDQITNRIIAELRRAEFVVADVTFHRQSVYFEAGYAMALGRPVIWTCKRVHFPKVHFDTRQYPHIIWENPENLRSQLRDQIRATVPMAKHHD